VDVAHEGEVAEDFKRKKEKGGHPQRKAGGQMKAFCGKFSKKKGKGGQPLMRTSICSERGKEGKGGFRLPVEEKGTQRTSGRPSRRSGGRGEKKKDSPHVNISVKREI